MALEALVFKTTDALALSNCQPQALAAACAAANALGRSAIWLDDRCTWLQDRIVGSDQGITKVVSERLFPYIYDGQMGIALFLAEISAVTGDPVLAELCGATVRHTLDVLDRKTSSYSGGFYIGWAGVGYALWRCGVLLDEPAIANRGLITLKLSAAQQSKTDTGSVDLLGGAAGKILLALHLFAVFGDEFWLEWARQSGRALIAAARHDRDGLSWPRGAGEAGLLGLSHGSAGIILALMRLQQCDANSVPSSVIHDALSRERRHYDKARGNWPDLRSVRTGETSNLSMMAWCHGAPGVLLVRHALNSAAPDAFWEEELQSAVLSTERDLVARLGQSGNLSYCHGVAGNAEALLTATGGFETWDKIDNPLSQWLSEQLSSDGDLSRPNVRDDRYGPLNFCPSLFLGLAGLGYFYLRLATRGRVPSILLPPGCC